MPPEMASENHASPPSSRRRLWRTCGWLATVAAGVALAAAVLTTQPVGADGGPPQGAPPGATRPATRATTQPNGAATQPADGAVARESVGNGDGGISPAVVARKLGKGFAITLLVAAASLTIGFFLSVPVGVVLNRNRGIAYYITRSFVDFIRGTPVLVQLYFVYFGSPVIGLHLAPITSAIATLSINAMAYMAEVVRSGLMSVDRGQMLAGRALGLSRWDVFRRIVWPQAFRIAIPPLMNSVVALIKDTALISIISVVEVVHTAKSLVSITYEPMKYYFIVALMFFVVTFPLMKLAGRLEERIRQKGYAHD
ncbi:MAG: amino acid ABC transporter permease [Phycisphaerae bacterium]|nr:amino acid ABC transporter permease [Phycisphaerae bacterium]